MNKFTLARSNALSLRSYRPLKEYFPMYQSVTAAAKRPKKRKKNEVTAVVLNGDRKLCFVFED